MIFMRVITAVSWWPLRLMCVVVLVGLVTPQTSRPVPCHARKCVDDLDWHNIGLKWHKFRDIVDEIGKHNTTDLREAIWARFQKAIDSPDGIASNSDLETLKQLQDQQDRRSPQVKDIEIKDPTTRYDNQVIIAMEHDMTVRKAANYLYSKHPGVSSLYRYNEASGQLELIAGKRVTLGENSRIQIVGHGRTNSGLMTLSNKSPGSIADLINELPIEGTKIGRISLVGCNLGHNADKNNFLDQAFAEQLLKEVDLKTSVSARKNLVSVRADGRKETGEITQDGIKWFSKDSSQKVIVEFDEYGYIVSRQSPVIESMASFPMESSGALGKITDVTRRGDIENIYMGENQRSSTDSDKWSLTSEPIRKITPNDYITYLDKLTSRTFKPADEFINGKLTANKDVLLNALSLNSIDASVYEVEAHSIQKQKVKNKQNPNHIDYSYFDGNIQVKNTDGHLVDYKFEIEQNLVGGALKLSLFKTIPLQIKGKNQPTQQELIDAISKSFLDGDSSAYTKHFSMKDGKFKIEYRNQDTSMVKTLTGELQKDLANRNDMLIETKIKLDMNVGARLEKKYVATLDNTYEKQVHVRDVRIMQDRNTMIDEINVFGLFGVDVGRSKPEHYLYYQFGDTVYTSRKNFYIYWEGMIASDQRPSEDSNSKLSENMFDVRKIKSWKWKNSYGRNRNPDGYLKTTYKDINSKLKRKYEDAFMEAYESTHPDTDVSFSSCKSTNDEITFSVRKGNKKRLITRDFTENKPLSLLEDFINGKHQQIKTKSTHILEGSVVLAVGVSEAIRNFNTYPITEVMIDLIKNPSFKMSYANMMDVHPMTRQYSWGNVGETGFDTLDNRAKPDNQRLRSSLQADSVVQPREMNLIRGYLLYSDRPISRDLRYRFYSENEVLKLDTKTKNKIKPIERSVLDSSFVDVISPENYRQGTQMSLPKSGPLGGSSENDLMQLVEYSENADIKIEPLRLPISLATDLIHIGKLTNDILLEKSSQTGQIYEIVEHSMQYEENRFSVKIRSKNSPEIEERVSVSLEDSRLANSELKDTVSDISESVSKDTISSSSMTRVNKALGVYGIVMGMRGAVNDFEHGRLFEGIINIAQTVHGIVGLSETAQQCAAKVISKTMTSEVQTIESSVTRLAETELNTAASEGKLVAGTAMDAAGVVGQGLTALGTVFGIYNTVQDLRRGTTLGYIDAGLDIAITITALLGPEAEIVAVALTIIRLAIDDFYYAIEKELSNLPENASVLQKIGAVLEGLLEGAVLVLKDIADFLSLGLISFVETANKIDEQYSKDHELLHKLSDYHEYFKVQKETGSTTKLINLAGGEESWNGGSVVFALNEDNSAELSMQIVNSEGQTQTERKHIVLDDNTNDIVLGVGESHDISFKKESAKILWFIPVYSRNLINKVTGDQGTLHGTYYGNSKDNKFFAIQSLPEGANVDYKLSEYFYELHGLDGNDVFYLGPQRSKVIGGHGCDTYIIPASGGKTIIDNYSVDEETDILYIDTDFSNIYAVRQGNNLDLKYNSEHHVIVMNWFSSSRSRHMIFKANKGTIYNVTSGVHDQVHLIPVAIILTGAPRGNKIDTSESIWKSVEMIIGSDFDDTLIGNDKNNHINGGKGANYMRGNSGSDTYIVDFFKSDIQTKKYNTIDNFDEQCKIDKAILSARFQDLRCYTNGNDMYFGTQTTSTVLKLKNWFVNEKFRHMLFVTSDDVIFKVDSDKYNTHLLHPIIIDASQETKGQKLDASMESLNEVVTIIGSNFDDILKGNNRNNYLDGGMGENILVGGEGKDVYIIRREYFKNTIDNFSEDMQDDIILIDYTYDEISIVSQEPNVLVCFERCYKYLQILNWSLKKENRHIQIRSNDGVTFRIAKGDSISGYIHKSPIEVDKSKAKRRQDILANANAYNTVQRIVGSNQTDYLVGNDLANVIEPGLGGAFMMGLNGPDKYVLLDSYNGSNKIDNFAFDDLSDSVSLPYYFKEIQTMASGSDLVVSSQHTNVSITLKDYVTDSRKRHMILKAERDGVLFTLSPENDFTPTAITLDKSLLDVNLALDLSKDQIWESVIEVLGSKHHNNIITGNWKSNTITGGEFSDTINGKGGNDVLRGEEGDDFLDGGDGDDILVGGAGNDWIDGSYGNDAIYPGPGSDYVLGGPGFDIVLFSGDLYKRKGVYVDLSHGIGYSGDAAGDIFVSVEGVTGTFFDDLIVGDIENNLLDGKEGNDVIIPLGGFDVMVGGEGHDTYVMPSLLKGAKVIRNYARDKAVDSVKLMLYKLPEIFFRRNSTHLMAYVGNYYDTPSGYFCPYSNSSALIFENWFEGPKMQHLKLELSDGTIDLAEFVDNIFQLSTDDPASESHTEECKKLENSIIDRLYDDDNTNMTLYNYDDYFYP